MPIKSKILGQLYATIRNRLDCAQSSRFLIVAYSCPNIFDFIGTYSHTCARTTHKYTYITFFCFYTICKFFGIIRIINRFVFKRPFENKSVDYPDYAKKLANRIKAKKSDVGILVCGSGTGMAISANKIKNIRAAVCYNQKSTRLCTI